MGSRSSSSSATSSSTTDARVATDGDSIGISAAGNVELNVVADEAFELAQSTFEGALSLIGQNSDSVFDLAGRTVAQSEEALASVIQSKKSEAGLLSEQLVKVGIPALAIAYVASRVLSK